LRPAFAIALEPGGIGTGSAARSPASISARRCGSREGTAVVKAAVTLAGGRDRAHGTVGEFAPIWKARWRRMSPTRATTMSFSSTARQRAGGDAELVATLNRAGPVRQPGNPEPFIALPVPHWLRDEVGQAACHGLAFKSGEAVLRFVKRHRVSFQSARNSANALMQQLAPALHCADRRGGSLEGTERVQHARALTSQSTGPGEPAVIR